MDHIGKAELRAIFVGGKVAMPPDRFRPIEWSRSARARRSGADDWFGRIAVPCGTYSSPSERATCKQETRAASSPLR